MKIVNKVLCVSAFTLICVTFGCKKKATTCNGVPNVAVNISGSNAINLSSPQYNAITVVGGSMVVTGGYDNIVIYHYLQDQFNAFDCCCPYDGGTSNSKAIVAIQSNKSMVTCPACGTTYNLSDGSVSKGPGKCSLKPYSTSYDASSTTLSVTN